MDRQPLLISTSRLEAFSDGVIAIIITVMVFDLKVEVLQPDVPPVEQLRPVFPKFASYVLSFLALAIMWVNHHQLLAQIKRTDRHLLWYNIHLLFWMSMIPFVTNFIGNNPLHAVAASFYGLVFTCNSLGFTLLRNYATGRGNLLHETISRAQQRKARRKNILGLSLYITGSLLAFLSIYFAYLCFIIVPVMYFLPEDIQHEKPTTA
ncbi:MAG: DUF1211 domain-containing protein [Lewinellaceae bacterium]|nr:DUF1211 domain-containing protein [Lewinellaceae bacterium]